MKKLVLLAAAAAGVAVFVRSKQNAAPAGPTRPAPQPWHPEPVRPTAEATKPAEATVVQLKPEQPAAEDAVEVPAEDAPAVEEAEVEQAVENLVAEPPVVEEMLAVAEPPLITEAPVEEAVEAAEAPVEETAEVLTAADFAADVKPATGRNKNRHGSRPAGQPNPPHPGQN